MDERASNVLGGLSGILYVLLWVAGLFVIVGFLPTLDSSDQELTEFLASSGTKIWAGGYIALLGFGFLLVFVARLAGLMRRAEGESGWLWILALAAAVAWVSIEMAAAAAEGAAFYAGRRGLDLQTTRGLITSETSGSSSAACSARSSSPRSRSSSCGRASFRLGSVGSPPLSQRRRS